MVELADSLDSGSSVPYGRAGSSPASRTNKRQDVGPVFFAVRTSAAGSGADIPSASGPAKTEHPFRVLFFRLKAGCWQKIVENTKICTFYNLFSDKCARFEKKKNFCQGDDERRNSAAQQLL